MQVTTLCSHLCSHMDGCKQRAKRAFFSGEKALAAVSLKSGSVSASTAAATEEQPLSLLEWRCSETSGRSYAFIPDRVEWRALMHRQSRSLGKPPCSPSSFLPPSLASSPSTSAQLILLLFLTVLLFLSHLLFLLNPILQFFPPGPTPPLLPAPSFSPFSSTLSLSPSLLPPPRSFLSPTFSSSISAKTSYGSYISSSVASWLPVFLLPQNAV